MAKPALVAVVGDRDDREELADALRRRFGADYLVVAEPGPAAALAVLGRLAEAGDQAAPALVIKGSCDYLSWSSGLAYRQALPGARLVYLHRAGHNAYQDQPAEFLATVRAFLAGRPLPTPPWAGEGVPGDYQGPP